ncbi:MAG: hypothetical protein QGG48_06210 [Desulfatiglandales bacterium]|nr:hypothetical protein [Desulfatiglandales bacterium]
MYDEKTLKDYPIHGKLSLRPITDYLNQTMADYDGTKLCLRKDLQELLKQAPKLYEPIEGLTLLKRHNDPPMKKTGASKRIWQNT